jgi:hypothetical protein
MTVSYDELGRGVVVQFGEAPEIREVISLPIVISTIQKDETVVLDFRPVRRLSLAAQAALMPALTSLRGRAVRALGLTSLDAELGALCPSAA